MTLYSLAKKYGTTVEELKKLNGLASDHIETNKPLRVPSNPDGSLENKQEEYKKVSTVINLTYTVKKGDTIFSIAVKNNMAVERLIELNNLTGTKIKEGQNLKVEPRQIP
jgi:LysM repeat protein